MISKNVQAIILAAGKARRFKTGRTKLLEPICGRPMILYPVLTLGGLNVSTVVVVGEEGEKISTTINLLGVKYVRQAEQLGTGHAVLCSKYTWEKDNILILNGDVPLITKELIQKFYEEHSLNDVTVSFMSTRALDPTGYGRVVKSDSGMKIVEDKDCTVEEREVDLVNAGVYLVKKEFLEKSLAEVTKSSVSDEYYITDIVNLASEQGEVVQDIVVPYDYVRGVNTLEELWAVEQIKRSEIIKHWMSEGVRFELAQDIHVDFNVEIGAGTFIGSGTHLLAGTKIGRSCSIGRFSILDNATVEENVSVFSHTVIKDSVLGKSSKVGPFAHLRNNVVTEEGSIIGNFVEIKKSHIGPKANVKHLSYIGDATLGKKVNIGAGTITCNYDGANKYRTDIEDDAFIGSNNTLIAPIKIGKRAYTAAGSTLNKDVPEGDLAVGRARQENKTGYADRLREKSCGAVAKLPSSKEVKGAEKLGISFFGAIKTDGFFEEFS